MKSQNFHRTLAIETSCDDTSVAIVESNGFVRGLCFANQDIEHSVFGGVVPEIASRNHTERLIPLIESCLKEAELSWKDIPSLSVTSRPGLVGSLIVGLTTAKTFAQVREIPFICINHLEGHLMAHFLRDEDYAPPEGFDYPYLALAISGGHTQLCWVKAFGEYVVLGRTLDDAGGEAFDKFAKKAGLGFPGGAVVDKRASQGNPKKFKFPRPLIKEDTLNFSFSGLKASVSRFLDTLSEAELKLHINDLCASYQQAIIDTLMSKLEKASQHCKAKNVVVTGGVSANSQLRKEASAWAKSKKLTLAMPPLRYCTDNAAMIGYAGLQRLQRGEASSLSEAPSPKSHGKDFLF